MKVFRTILVAVIFLAFIYLIFTNAATIIFLLCAIVAVMSIVSYVLLIFQQYSDSLNKPKRIKVESKVTFISEDFFEEKYRKNVMIVKNYFENRYLSEEAKIVYLFEKGKNGFEHNIFIAVDDFSTFLEIKEIIESLIDAGKEFEFYHGLPTIVSHLANVRKKA